jgi:hypothetical protein
MIPKSTATREGLKENGYATSELGKDLQDVSTKGRIRRTRVNGREQDGAT